MKRPKAKFRVGQRVLVRSVRRRAIIDVLVKNPKGGVVLDRRVDGCWYWNVDALRPLPKREIGPRPKRGKPERKQ